MSYPSPLTIHFPGKLVFGNGVLDQLAGEIRQLSAASVMILTIEPLLPRLTGLFAALESEGITASIDTSIVQEPSFADFERLMGQVRPLNPDVVIGIGGGSVLDVAKLVAAQLDSEQTL